MYRTDRRLYFTSDKARVVEHGEPEAAFLMAAAGHEISDEDAERFGLKERLGQEDKEVKVRSTKTAIVEPETRRGRRAGLLKRK